MELWWGVLAPAATPREVVARLNAEINKALSTEEVKAFLLREGAEPAPMTPEAFTRLIAADIERWRKVADNAGIKAD